jgi:RecB family exonuclease
MERGDFPRRGSGTCTDSPSVSLSSLDEWRECPYRYWCRNNIRLPEHGKRLYDPMKAGTLLHTLWERCWGGYLSCGTSFSVLLRQEWESVSSECYPELRSDPRLGRHADELLKQASAVADLLDRVESSDAVKRRRRTGIEYALPEYETGGVIFKGRADRIDFYDDGFVVIDYKSNRAGDHRKDLQLAAYAAVIKNTTGAVPLGYGWIGHKDASFYGHFRSDVLSDAYLSARSRKKLEAALEEAEKAMKDMAESVNKGDFPANYDSSMCRYCEYIVICRRKEGHFEEAGEENGEGYGDDS